MHANRNAGLISVGLVTDEPIRLAGLVSIFEGHTLLAPVTGTLEHLLADRRIAYLVVDLNAPGGLETMTSIRRARPDIRQIVIGPEGNEELIMESIVAGARAYLGSTDSTAVVCKAIEIVTEGSIWAPRRVLSKLIDRLLAISDEKFAGSDSTLTERESQVLELILLARSNREIATQLGIEERTVKAHVGRLMRKTGSDNRIELSMRALRQPLGTRGGPIRQEVD